MQRVDFESRNLHSTTSFPANLPKYRNFALPMRYRSVFSAIGHPRRNLRSGLLSYYAAPPCRRILTLQAAWKVRMCAQCCGEHFFHPLNLWHSRKDAPLTAILTRVVLCVCLLNTEVRLYTFPAIWTKHS